MIILEQHILFTMISSSFYNVVASEYESYCTISGVDAFLEDDIDLVQQNNPCSILEFGIGNGRFAKAYLKKYPHTLYVGVDNSKEMLSHATSSGAILIFEAFESYVKQLIEKGTQFDSIIAPYSVFHHVVNKKQFEIFQDMKQVTNRIIINCVTKDKEQEIFKHNNETEITFILQNGNNVTTTVYTLDETIRSEMSVRNTANGRENLIWERIA